MTHSPRRSSLEGQPLLISIPNLNQPTGKWRWIFASATSLGGTGGVGYVAVKSFISGAVANGFILGAGSLICAGSCVYCMYRVVIALRTRTIEPDVEVPRVNTLALRSIHTRLNGVLNLNELEQRIADERLEDTINQQLTQLEQLRSYNIKPLNPVFDVSAEANVLLLQTIYTRLNTLLNLEQEEKIDDETLYGVIDQQLGHLEQTLPAMTQQLLDLQSAIQNAMLSRSVGSANTSGYNSPSAESTGEHDLFAKLEAWNKKVKRDQASANTSRLNSAFSSPNASGKGSITSTPIARANPSTRTNEKPNPPKLDFSTVNHSDSDSDEKC